MPSGFSEQGCRPHFDPHLMLKALYTRSLGLDTAHSVPELVLRCDNDPIINPYRLTKNTAPVWLPRPLSKGSGCSKINDFLQIKYG